MKRTAILENYFNGELFAAHFFRCCLELENPIDIEAANYDYGALIRDLKLVDEAGGYFFLILESLVRGGAIQLADKKLTLGTLAKAEPPSWMLEKMRVLQPETRRMMLRIEELLKTPLPE